MGNVVVGFIDTPEGRAAVAAGVDETRRRGGSLILVHSMMGGGRDSSEDYLAAAKALEEVREYLSAAGVQHEVHEFVRGNRPSEDLVDAADRYDADVIVIGIRKRSATGKVLLGSNALDLLHDATVPVLCVKAT